MNSRLGILEERRQPPTEKVTSKKTLSLTQVTHNYYHFTQNNSQSGIGPTNISAEKRTSVPEEIEAETQSSHNQSTEGDDQTDKS